MKPFTRGAKPSVFGISPFFFFLLFLLLIFGPFALVFSAFKLLADPAECSTWYFILIFIPFLLSLGLLCYSLGLLY